MNEFRDRLNRRDFSTGLLAGAAITSSRLALAETSTPSKAIDAHVHVWTGDTDRYPLADGFQVEAMKPATFTPQELFAHCRPAGVSRIVLIQMSFYRFDNRYMLETIAKHPGVFSGVGIVDHHAPDVADKIRKLARGGVRGFRLHARGNDAATWLADDGMATLWKTVRQEGLAVCPLINPSDLPHVEAMCRQYPGTKVVIDHFARVGIKGRVDTDELEQLCRLARFPDVHVKTSAFYALGKKKPPYDDLLPMIRKVVDKFGPERLMWASDCPFQVQGDHTYEASIALIRDRADFLSDSDKQQILSRTAERVFFG